MLFSVTWYNLCPESAANGFDNTNSARKLLDIICSSQVTYVNSNKGFWTHIWEEVDIPDAKVKLAHLDRPTFEDLVFMLSELIVD